MRYLQQLYPPRQRSRVVLLLSTRTKRHFEWYSPDFRIVSPIPPPESIPEVTKDAVAVYTDDPWVPLPSKWYRIPLNAFTRSVIIYWKVHYLELYLVDRPTVRKIVRDAAAHDYRWSALILGIVESPAFLMRASSATSGTAAAVGHR